jgi:hypothetical protein
MKQQKKYGAERERGGEGRERGGKRDRQTNATQSVTVTVAT